VTETFSEEIADMAVIQRIVDDPAIFPMPDDPQGAEQPQLMGYGRFCGSQETGDVANAEFFQGKSVENTDSGGVAKHLERFGKTNQYCFRWSDVPDSSYLCLVN
jgi:hypothetical protein